MIPVHSGEYWLRGARVTVLGQMFFSAGEYWLLACHGAWLHADLLWHEKGKPYIPSC